VVSVVTTAAPTTTDGASASSDKASHAGASFLSAVALAVLAGLRA
jgi:hypothetical protein